MKTILLLTITVFLFCSLASATACSNGASFTQGAWLNYTPTITNMTGVTVSEAAYQVDAYCNISVVIRFVGTAVAWTAPTFTTPFAATLPFQFIPAIFANQLTDGSRGGGPVVMFPASNNSTWTLYPYPEGLPAPGEIDDYRIVGTYR